MKPSWDKLMTEFEGSEGALVGDVDCTEDGKQLCEDQGVEGFPTIKWGDPAALEDYDGGREYDDLLAFAQENLKPICSPKNLDLCDADKKKQITELMAMPKADLDAKMAEMEALNTEANSHFEKEVEALQARYEELEKEKTATLAKVKDSGLSLMKAVSAHLAGDKEEL